MGAQDWASVAAAVAAAIAAVASWRSSRVAARAYQSSVRPLLQLQPTYDMESGMVRIHIENAGGGLAKQVGWLFIGGGRVFAGAVSPSGFLRPGAGVTVEPQPPLTEDDLGEAIIVCLDAENSTHLWSRDGRHKRLPLRRLGKPRPFRAGPELFALMYPGLDLAEFVPGRWRQGVVR